MPEMIKSPADIKTAPFDPRFPNTNQTSVSSSDVIIVADIGPKTVSLEHCTACRTDGERFMWVAQDSSSWRLLREAYAQQWESMTDERHCYQSYLDFHRCQKVRGEKYAPCQYFKRVYRSLCPNEWVDKWDGQREQGTFPGRI